MRTFISDISGKHFPENQRINLLFVKSNIVDFIKKDYPEINEDSNISLNELDEYRERYIEYTLKSEFNELSYMQKEVISKIADNELISNDIEKSFNQKLTIGQRVADKVAYFGGSWKFIIFFSIIILLWVSLNTFLAVFNKFDPYPFILLNLFLSCLAAFQAPIIMMSQNRQEDKDRARSKEDYKVNLKSELEIRMLQEKMDHLLLVQQQRLFEIQNIQIEMLKEISKDISNIELKKSK